ncbi:MAG: hypothetical protein JW953_04685 [Anaerolineae bacterium]|nr:hypothetical protein [Anaerolineae bacterium]
MNNDIQNPGSALGEAIGAEMEKALNIFLTDLVESQNFYFISKSPFKNRKKLLMYDKFGTAYNVDAVIANESMQPVILIESKYIRYKKHNRDKGSWVCTAHPALRRRYASIRSSIAVLAGNWSSSSITMMKSHDINIFLIPFSRICDLLAQHDIDFDWDEKDRESAIVSWQRYLRLSNDQRANIGVEMVNDIKAELEMLVLNILDDTVERQISKVVLEFHSNLGEVQSYEFEAIPEAIDFLNQTELKDIFIISDSLTLFDPPPIFEDDI